MKARRFLFRAPAIFGCPLKYGVPVFVGFTVLVSGLDAQAGDILRGGSSANNKPGRGNSAGGSATPAATDAARANARDTLARTNRTMDAVRNMQKAARNTAIRNSVNHLGGHPGNTSVPLPKVPNGIALGGLKPTADPTKWTGADAPVQAVKDGRTKVTIKQTSQQALLSWDTFNVGNKTTVKFDQSKGGNNSGQWIAFNKVNDPSGNPTQILGNIKAEGQVYLINTNGIIFGGGSQVNARGFTASALPINDNLVARGLLNNPDAQFLFSGLSVPAGSDGTPAFDPGTLPAGGKYGDVTVQAGAVLKSPAGSGGNGGRIMLVGANVTNNGKISTESGQTVLAAGLQVGVAAHDGDDPSLRGLDVWVGAVGDYAGSVKNSGIIEAFTGSVWMGGKNVSQLGVIASTTSVNFNGRIDLKASYGAVGNPNFDSKTETGSGAPMFFNQYTGTVTLGEGSVTRILPDYLSKKTVPGTALPERSRINIEGLDIRFENNSTVYAPNAEVSVRAGLFPYKDSDGNRTILDANGQVEAGLTNYYTGGEQRMFFKEGTIRVDDGATIDVSGSSDVFVALAQSILKVELRGTELADSPLIRDTDLRGAVLTVDLRNSGIYNGKYWVGTPLGDVTGLAGLIERNAGQLTAKGGNIDMKAGGSISVNKGATLDVSGGSFLHEGGIVRTSSLIAGGRLVAMEDATPDQKYTGVFNGSTTIGSAKWGLSKTYDIPLFTGRYEVGFVEGAAAGTLSLTAGSMKIKGDLRGTTVEGPRQHVVAAGQGTLRLTYENEKAVTLPGSTTISYIKSTENAPDLVLGKDLSAGLVGKNGFGILEIVNPDGSIKVPENLSLSAQPRGSISLTAANISVLGDITATGGKLSFTTYNISPTEAAEFRLLNPSGDMPYPAASEDRGNFVLGKNASLSTAAGLIDDSAVTRVIDGGSVSIRSYNAVLEKGSSVDVSGGAYVSESFQVSYGKGGSITVAAGDDPGFSGVIGGSLTLDAKLSGYSGAGGGSLSLQAGRVRIGGTPQAGALNLDEKFFRQGGFTNYALTGIGGETGNALVIAAGTKLSPRAASLVAVQDENHKFTLERTVAAKGVRAPVNLSFSATGADDPATLTKLEAIGSIVMGTGAEIRTDPGATVSFKGQTVTLLGSVITPGGNISVAGGSAYPLTAEQRNVATYAMATVHLGKNAVLSSAGVTQLLPDEYNRRIGRVYDGGTISISGNIVAESGSVMDVSGTSGVLDLDPSSLANPSAASVPGLNTTPFLAQGVATRVDSNGGVISLTGSQMLVSDATLLGNAGGSTATGGQLSVFSGAFYRVGQDRTGADVNLVVRQGGNLIVRPGADMGVGKGLFDSNGNSYGNAGYFTVDRFTDGGFASLDLGGRYNSSGNPIPYGGNIDFQGKIKIVASGSVRLAGGGVIRADDTVKISASYLSVGQEFRAPAHPDDVFVPFVRDPAFPTADYHFAPTGGAGRLSFDAKLIDIGTVSMQGIGKVDLTADGGDIRGNGTLSMAGDLTLTAAQVYPTTLGEFNIFAYDPAGGKGSVTIRKSGESGAPLSAGGKLSIYSSEIRQGGVLRAPLGTIRLGWDGTDLDPSDADMDKPVDIIAGTTISVPVSDRVTLENGSVTSVSAKGLQIPFGISRDGLSWIDPRGVNVTLSGLPEKAVYFSGNKVKMQSGATVDLSGGGDLLATRWIQGIGGSKDLLGTASAVWGSGTEYQPGELVTYQGETYSARVRNSGQAPGSNLYWSKVEESFAIVPGYSASYAPYGAFNTGVNADALGGAPGYVDGGLKVGDTITLDGSTGLPAGTYTLLPRGYAILKGAFLVTPLSSGGTGTILTAEGTSLVSGYTANAFNPTAETTPLRSRFEITPGSVLKDRVTYTIYSANDFIKDAGGKQLLPTDAGYAAFHGNNSLELAGKVLTDATGRGALVDISSFTSIRLTGGSGSADGGAGSTLDTGVLASWGVDSLLIGGIRHRGTDTTTVEVRTDSLTLDNAGSTFEGPEIVLASRGGLKVTAGSSLVSNGKSTGGSQDLRISGDGALLRVSGDEGATVTRGGLTGSTSPMLDIGAGATISGSAVIADSTYGTFLSPEAKLEAKALTLSSGQINIVFDGATGDTSGNPYLTLSGVTLDNVQQAESLTLQSYRSIDFHGSGVIGGEGLEKITFSAGGVRGFDQGAGGVLVRADQVSFENRLGLAAPSAAPAQAGNLTIQADTIQLGSKASRVSGFGEVNLNASGKILFTGEGSFTTAGNLKADSPLITGAGGSIYSINAGGAVVLAGKGGTASGGDLGASLSIEGASIVANADILLPSGELNLRATQGDVKVGGTLSVDGTWREFNDITRVTNAGSITLESKTGDVIVTEGGKLSVSASVAGGSAGTLEVLASNGVFSNAGKLAGRGNGDAGVNGGKFVLDVGSFGESGDTSLAGISKALDAGDFYNSRNFRVRTGDVNIAGYHRSKAFSLSADQGSILVSGGIDASGTTGGSISLSARGNLTLAAGSVLSVEAQKFDSAGKGGSILLESGTQRDGAANQNSLLDLQSGSSIRLGVAEYVPGSYTTVGSSASQGKFNGTLHLRAPRTTANNDILIDSLESSITGASAIIVEGFKVYNPANGVLNIAQRNQMHADSLAYLGAAGTGNANEVAMRNKLVAGSPDSAALDSLMVLSAGVEMVNLNGDLVLGAANNSSAGSANTEALAGADWDLSTYRYGSRGAAGVLTLRASGDIIFNNTLSDGFTPIAQGSAQTFADNGHSLMWLARLTAINANLPVNAQSWSYRITAGADLNASDSRKVLTAAELEAKNAGKGSVIVGEFYPAVPNSISSGTSAGNGTAGQTADSIRISTNTTNRGTRFEVVRTGTGDITVNAGRDVQLRNQFSTIYTAGVALPVSTTVFSENDFVVPILPTTTSLHPVQTGASGSTLGEIQQLYPATWSMAGGNISLHAGNNIGRYTMVDGVLTVDSSRQMPTNWLYRRGYVDPTTGLFASNGGFGTNTAIQNATNINDAATSTAWWIDYSNFFQGVGTLGGGNINLTSGNDIVNVDAVAPTNARMAGRVKNPDFGTVAGAPEYINLAPDADNLLELGGGDITVNAGRDISGGVYYVERGKGDLFAGGGITTNAARTVSTGILESRPALDPNAWMPTMLFAGKSSFDVAARGDILLGPVSNPFLLPQGINNKYWYKTYFSTLSADAAVNVSSYGGSVTHRNAVTLSQGGTATPLLAAWFGTHNLFSGSGSSSASSYYQPWLRLAELELQSFNGVFNLTVPTIRSTAFGGDINLTGDITLAPSPKGTLELVASGAINGVQDTGLGQANFQPVRVWTASTVNVSDASPESIPGVLNPLGYQTVAGRTRLNAVQSLVNILESVTLSLSETGSSRGVAGSSAVKQALHDPDILHAGDRNPVRLYATGGDISGLTLFSPKMTKIMAERDITDVAFYLQNISVSDISLVSAGRDIIPFNENAAIRATAGDITLGNIIGDPMSATAAGISTNAMAGDIQVSGPGVLEVISGRNLDLGTGANFDDGTSTGITSIGNIRNPALPFAGADIIALAGVTAADGSGAADGLANSLMNITGFVEKYLKDDSTLKSAYMRKLRTKLRFSELTPEQQAIVALETYYEVLRDAGLDSAKTGSYKPGYEAVRTMFGKEKPEGDILTRAREIRTTTGGAISLASAGGGITMANAIFGNPLTPPGIVTEYGGSISTFTDQDVDIGQARIFTLRGGHIMMWSSRGNIAAGTSPKTVVTAPPTRVVVNISSADVQTDLGGLATGGGIGVLASVEGVEADDVNLVAPKGYVDAGDAGIRVTGNLNIAAQVVLNASNISVGGASTGTGASSVSAPSVTTVTAASNSSAAAAATLAKPEPAPVTEPAAVEEVPSVYEVSVIGYGGEDSSTEGEEEEELAPQP